MASALRRWGAWLRTFGRLGEESMSAKDEDEIRRVAIELDRLDQEVRTLRHLLDESCLD
jgi:hypothetical protein